MTSSDDLRRIAAELQETEPYEVRKALTEAADRIDELERAVVVAVAELRAEHRPDSHPGKDPYGCLICFPSDGSWPCVSRMIADDLAALFPTPIEAPPMTISDDLTADLRNPDVCGPHCMVMRNQAADRIKELEASNARLREYVRINDLYFNEHGWESFALLTARRELHPGDEGR